MCAKLNSDNGTRLVRIVGLALGLSLAIGCGSKPDGNPKLQNSQTDSNKNVNNPNESAQTPSPDEFEKKFVQSLADGKASAGDLTPAFKKKIAGPRKGIEDDQKLGYNPDGVDSFLKVKFKNPLLQEARDGKVAYFSNDKTPSLLKLVYSDGTGWKVDWLHTTHIAAQGIEITPKNHNVVAPARSFLEPLLAGDLVLSEAAMSRAWKVRVAGSDNPSDKDLGYSRGQLQNYIRQWADHHTGYQIQMVDVDSPTGTVLGELTGGMTQKFNLKVVKDPSGEWLVDDLKLDQP